MVHLDAPAIEQVLADAAQRSGVQNPKDDKFWKTSSESSSASTQLKVYAPLSSKAIREVCLPLYPEDFLGTMHFKSHFATFVCHVRHSSRFRPSYIPILTGNANAQHFGISLQILSASFGRHNGVDSNNSEESQRWKRCVAVCIRPASFLAASSCC